MVGEETPASLAEGKRFTLIKSLVEIVVILTTTTKNTGGPEEWRPARGVKLPVGSQVVA